MEIKPLGMMDQLRMIRGVESITPNKTQGTPDSGNGNKVSFMDYLEQQFSETNKLGLEAENAIQRSATGEETNPHEAMIAVQKADIALTLLMSVKDRIERAYTDLIRTPI
ncbi:MAG: flagellar hook-basal body complex protein FliE [Bdellovibrionota bacterium]